MRKQLSLALCAFAMAGTAAAQNNCVTTLFAANNGGSIGGAVYFDITVTQNVSFSGLQMNTAELTTVGLTIYTTPGTYVGQEANMAAWTQVAEDDGLALGQGRDLMTPVNLLAPFTLTPGTYGIALVADNTTTGAQVGHDYTNGNGTNQNYTSADTVLALSLGSATNVPFTGSPFSPRVWNGELCHGMSSTGTNYCTATPNSTGNAASMSAAGTASVAANNLVLECSDMPLSSFGFFLTSQTQGLVMNPGGSQGDLCLGGAIGRFVGPGQIQNSGGNGAISLAIDNSMQPTPTGLVQIVAGETWNFTAWYRDAVGGMATSNFADGLQVDFQ